MRAVKLCSNILQFLTGACRLTQHVLHNGRKMVALLVVVVVILLNLLLLLLLLLPLLGSSKDKR